MSASIDRLQSDWVYQGAAVLKAPALTRGQKAYALTLRRQLAQQLEGQANAVVVTEAGPRHEEFEAIAHACRREVFRTARAARRLAHQVHA